MKNSLSLVSLTLAAALCANVAMAQNAPAPTGSSDSGAPSFSELDKDNKGYIVRKDVPKDVSALKELRAHFNEADADHDGKVTSAEYNAYINKSSTQHKP
ncbi:EF hand domain-containing protein [Luteibacter rhizovicinus]|uniref:EF hand domain-containing protein n=1 Tax=Luteibacter rhizovicinus TaxID=242606 RepID=A0A4R3YVH7_9GAMM|nr:EF-hand domain-containing protein [Luteibacter rhizovicinus]TCV97115.1 EF hand domain-containing protein [Luteibacter rhizovicinus]